MDILLALGHSAAIALSLSLAFTGFMIMAGVGDQPDARSSHSNVTPTCGGIGLLAGIGGAALSISLFYPSFISGSVLPKVLSIGLGFGLLGLTDDVYGAQPGFKMLLIAVLSALSVWAVGPVTALPMGELANFDLPIWAGYAGSVLWVFVIVNAVNFMDGANGMMGACVACAALVLTGVALIVGAPQTAILAGALMAGLLGFLPYNFRKKAMIFAGDVGSLFAGFVLAIAALLLVQEAPKLRLVYVGPLLVLPFLTDVFLTLIRRLRRGENLTQAHNQHLYQRLIQSGASHTSISALYAVATLACGFIALGGVVKEDIQSINRLAIMTAFSCVMYAAAFWMLKRKPVS